MHNVAKRRNTLKILRCEHRKILKVCLAILQNYTSKSSPILRQCPLSINAENTRKPLVQGVYIERKNWAEMG